MTRARVAVLISGSGSNLQALIDAASASDYPAEIAYVLSNKPDAYGLVRAAQAGIPTEVVEHGAFATREAFDAAMQARLEAANVDYVCLAGFMRLLTPSFTEAWAGRMLNIHPSLLPAFPGLHTHRRALEAGVRLSGCTVHFVTPELDAGPILMQAAVPVRGDDTPESLQQRVHATEHRIYPAALALLASGQARLEAGRVVLAPEAEGVASGILISPSAPR